MLREHGRFQGTLDSADPSLKRGRDQGSIRPEQIVQKHFQFTLQHQSFSFLPVNMCVGNQAFGWKLSSGAAAQWPSHPSRATEGPCV